MTQPQDAPALTIGIPCYDDYDGLWFTVTALRLYHADQMPQVEILVVDNNPGSPAGQAVREFIEGSIPDGRYLPLLDPVGTAPAKNAVFRAARGEFVLCLDSHVLLERGALRGLLEFCREHPDCDDLLQGPILHESLLRQSTHLRNVWFLQMRGVWDCFPGKDAGIGPDDPPCAVGEAPPAPFEIPSQGTGLFACRRAAWPGFHPLFRGFGGEEGYIHDKFRRLGRRVLCLPFLRWVHRFKPPGAAPYKVTVEDKVRNYLIGNRELGQDPTPTIAHFQSFLAPERLQEIIAEVAQLPIEPLNPRAVRGPEPETVVPGKISCLMATYGRWSKAREAITCFLQQDYPHRELVILNSHPTPLRVSHPLVRVINETGFATLGHARNRLLREADGEFLRTWDDDDLYLPWAVSQGVAHIGGAAAFKPARSWLAEAGHGLRLAVRVFESSITMRTEHVRRIGYGTGAGDEHMPLIIALTTLGGVAREFGPWSSYVYRWGDGSGHIAEQIPRPGAPEDKTRQWQSLQNDDGSGRPFEPADLDAHWEQLALYADGGRDFLRRLVTFAPEFSYDCVPDELVSELINKGLHGARQIVAAEFPLDPEQLPRHARRGPSLTRQLATHPAVRRIYSIRPFGRLLWGDDAEIPPAALGKLNVLATAELQSFEPIDLLIIDRPNDPSAVLRCFHSIAHALSDVGVIAVTGAENSGTVSLIRSCLDPTHGAARFGDTFAFAPRPIPQHLTWRGHPRWPEPINDHRNGRPIASFADVKG